MSAIPFWLYDPTILFNKNYICELWFTQNMTFEQKLNAISRLVIVLTSIGYLVTNNWSIIMVGVITLAIIISLYKLRKTMYVESFSQKRDKSNTNLAMTTNPVTLKSELKSNFYPTTKRNPFGNVLLTDIGDDPDRKSAPPSFNPDVYDDITKAVKKQTQMLNPEIINTGKQLYGDLKDNYDLDNSMMRFYATANTRVANDQGAYAQYLYGGMYSGKEDTPEGAMMRVKDNWQWINP